MLSRYDTEFVGKLQQSQIPDGHAEDRRIMFESNSTTTCMLPALISLGKRCPAVKPSGVTTIPVNTDVVRWLPPFRQELDRLWWRLGKRISYPFWLIVRYDAGRVLRQPSSRATPPYGHRKGRFCVTYVPMLSAYFQVVARHRIHVRHR